MALTVPFSSTPLPPIESYDDIDTAVAPNDKLSAANECSQCYRVVTVYYLDDHVIVIADVQRQATKLNKTDADLLEALVRGFLPDIRQFVLLKEPTSSAEAVNHARLAQAVHDSHPSGSNIISAIDAMTAKMDQMVLLVIPDERLVSIEPERYIIV